MEAGIYMGNGNKGRLLAMEADIYLGAREEYYLG